MRQRKFPNTALLPIMFCPLYFRSKKESVSRFFSQMRSCTMSLLNFHWQSILIFVFFMYEVNVFVFSQELLPVFDKLNLSRKLQTTTMNAYVNDPYVSRKSSPIKSRKICTKIFFNNFIESNLWIPIGIIPLKDSFIRSSHVIAHAKAISR